MRTSTAHSQRASVSCTHMDIHDSIVACVRSFVQACVPCLFSCAYTHNTHATTRTTVCVCVCDECVWLCVTSQRFSGHVACGTNATERSRMACNASAPFAERLARDCAAQVDVTPGGAVWWRYRTQDQQSHICIPPHNELTLGSAIRPEWKSYFRQPNGTPITRANAPLSNLQQPTTTG